MVAVAAGDVALATTVDVERRRHRFSFEERFLRVGGAASPAAARGRAARTSRATARWWLDARWTILFTSWAGTACTEPAAAITKAERAEIEMSCIFSYAVFQRGEGMSLQEDLGLPDKIRLLKNKKQSNAPGTA